MLLFKRFLLAFSVKSNIFKLQDATTLNLMPQCEIEESEEEKSNE